MKSTFGQITVADLKKGVSLITFQLESDDSVFHNLFSKEYEKNEREKVSEKIVKQILKPHKDFNYGKQHLPFDHHTRPLLRLVLRRDLCGI